MEKIVVVGAGPIGCAWASVFERAGHPVTLYDVSPDAVGFIPRLTNLIAHKREVSNE